MLDDVHSALLAQWLKKKIRTNEYYRLKLKMLLTCMTYGPYNHGVQVISNGQETRIIGPRPCLNAWACPECTANKMKKYSTRIAAGIDALAKQGYSAAMFTMTIFHTVQQSCEDSYFLLRKAWELMDKQKTWRRKKKDGTYYVNAGIWSQFYNQFKFTHSVKTLEITYGKHGWHPHIHMLIWFKNEDLQKIADWEPKLIECWNDSVDRAAKLLYGDSKKYEIRKFLESKMNRPDSGHLGLYISKTENGKIRKISSSDYLCGFGGDNELTGLNLKVANGENMTPFQILEKAYELETTDIIQSNRLVELYLHFAWVVIKNRISRIAFSRTGLRKIIDNWLQTEEFKSIVKKKKDSLNLKPFRNIAWFSSKQWSDICFSSRTNVYIIPLIKCFACYENGYELICELMIANNLSPPLAKSHPTINWAKAFNDLLEIADVA